MDAFFVHPAKGKPPAVIMWPDIASLRDAFKAMARRLASAGYSVIVPNPFYSDAPAPQFADFDAFRKDNGFRKVGPMDGEQHPGCGRRHGQGGGRRLRQAARGRHEARRRRAGLLHERHLDRAHGRGSSRPGQGARPGPTRKRAGG